MLFWTCFIPSQNTSIDKWLTDWYRCRDLDTCPQKNCNIILTQFLGVKQILLHIWFSHLPLTMLMYRDLGESLWLIDRIPSFEHTVVFSSSVFLDTEVSLPFANKCHGAKSILEPVSVFTHVVHLCSGRGAVKSLDSKVWHFPNFQGSQEQTKQPVVPNSLSRFQPSSQLPACEQGM